MTHDEREGSFCFVLLSQFLCLPYYCDFKYRQLLASLLDFKFSSGSNMVFTRSMARKPPTPPQQLLPQAESSPSSSTTDDEIPFLFKSLNLQRKKKNPETKKTKKEAPVSSVTKKKCKKKRKSVSTPTSKRKGKQSTHNYEDSGYQTGCTSHNQNSDLNHEGMDFTLALPCDAYFVVDDNHSGYTSGYKSSDSDHEEMDFAQAPPRDDSYFVNDDTYDCGSGYTSGYLSSDPDQEGIDVVPAIPYQPHNSYVLDEDNCHEACTHSTTLTELFDSVNKIKQSISHWNKANKSHAAFGNLINAIQEDLQPEVLTGTYEEAFTRRLMNMKREGIY